MIIETLNRVLLGVFTALTAPIQIESMPAGVRSALETALEYISAGFGFVGQFCNLGYLVVLFGLILAVDAGVMIYKMVMWVLKKIPFLGIE